MDKNLKFLIIGGSAGGSNVAVELRYRDESSEIIVIEEGPDISYSNCSQPYYFSGEIESIDDLVLNTPEDFRDKYNIDARTGERVESIDEAKKLVEIENLETGEIYTESYDYLILTTGARSNFPDNFKKESVFKLRVLDDTRKIDEYLKSHDVKDVVVVGNGYIGVELAEVFTQIGKNVKLVGSHKSLLANIDEDMAQIVHKYAIDNGVELVLGNRLKETTETGVILEDGTEIKSDLTVVSIGIKPETTLAEETGLEIGETGCIKIDDSYRTSDESIYAIGDATEVFSPITKEPSRVPLAGAIHIGAKKLADGIYGTPRDNKGYIGPSILRFFNIAVGEVGLNEKAIKDLGYEYDSSFISGLDCGIDGKPLSIKILFEKPSGRLLGAQIVGENEILKQLNPLSVFIKFNMTVYDLYDTELAYHPTSSRPMDLINIAAYSAIENLEGKIKKVPLTKVRRLVEDKEYILDTRSSEKFKKSHLIGAIHIPKQELRERVDEIPRDRDVYVDRYSSFKILKNLGLENIIYIEGNIEDIKLYEYYRESVLGYKSIIE